MTVCHSCSDGSLQTPVLRQYKTISIGESSAVEVACVSFAVVNEVVVASYSGYAEKMSSLRTGAEPISHLRCYRSASGVDVEYFDSVVSRFKIECDVAVDAEFRTDVRCCRRSVERICLQCHPLCLCH